MSTGHRVELKDTEKSQYNAALLSLCFDSNCGSNCIALKIIQILITLLAPVE